MTELHSHERAHATEDLGTRQPEAEEHGSEDRGATYVMQTVLHASERSVSLDGHHQGPFGSPLPRRCTCRRGASLARGGGRSFICYMHGQECIATPPVVARGAPQLTCPRYGSEARGVVQYRGLRSLIRG